MKKVVFLLSFLAFALADENDWLNQWTNPNTEPKASQSSGIKSVAYYKQNKGEARKVAQECEIKILEFMEQLSANELEKLLTGDEAEVGLIMIKKLGATFVMNCANVEEALGITLFK